MDTASVKLEVTEPPTASRCQAVKFQVSPATTVTSPVGVGVWVRSSASWNAPPVPEFLI